MRVRAMVLAFAALFAVSGVASAQQQTGEIFGKVTDSSGAVLPGVTVTLSAPHLLQPLTAVTSDTGTYQFPRLPIGTYEVKFELTGFKTVVNQEIYVTVGFSAQVDASGFAPGTHWLALRIHGRDGSIETLAQQTIVIAGRQEPDFRER